MRRGFDWSIVVAVSLLFCSCAGGEATPGPSGSGGSSSSGGSNGRGGSPESGTGGTLGSGGMGTGGGTGEGGRGGATGSGGRAGPGGFGGSPGTGVGGAAGSGGRVMTGLGGSNTGGNGGNAGAPTGQGGRGGITATGGSSGGTSGAPKWVGTWTAAPYVDTSSSNAPPISLANSVIRQVAHVSLGGSQIRVQFSNLDGNGSLVINAAHIAMCGAAANASVNSTIDTSTDKALTFSKATSVTERRKSAQAASNLRSLVADGRPPPGARRLPEDGRLRRPDAVHEVAAHSSDREVPPPARTFAAASPARAVRVEAIDGTLIDLEEDAPPNWRTAPNTSIAKDTYFTNVASDVKKTINIHGKSSSVTINGVHFSNFTVQSKAITSQTDTDATWNINQYVSNITFQ